MLCLEFEISTYSFQVEPNDRDDLWLQPGRRKISGSAARIIRQVAYHHLTLLVNVDIDILRRSLSSAFSVSLLILLLEVFSLLLKFLFHGKFIFCISVFTRQPMVFYVFCEFIAWRLFEIFAKFEGLI